MILETEYFYPIDTFLFLMQKGFIFYAGLSLSYLRDLFCFIPPQSGGKGKSMEGFSSGHRLNKAAAAYLACSHDVLDPTQSQCLPPK